MQLSIGLLLPTLLGSAYAAADIAKVFIISGSEQQSHGDVPALSSADARLVLAQRLGISQYHKLHEVSTTVLSYINKFGIQSQSLFADHAKWSPNQLVVVAEGWTPSLLEDFEKSYGQSKPQFEISSPAPASANNQLVEDLNVQLLGHSGAVKCSFEDEFDPYSDCWDVPNKIIHLDMSITAESFFHLASTLQKYISSEALDLILIAMPESSRSSKPSSKPYGIYDMPTTQHPKRQELEDPLEDMDFVQHQTSTDTSTEIVDSSAASNKTIKGIVPFCHSSLDLCISATNNCTGHGSCYKKFGDDKVDCFTCGCVADFHKDDKGSTKTIYWGGGACQKRDISSQFWLIATFTVTLVGLISWAIGMMFSIGEERLPGVIGAGVSPVRAGGR